EVGRRLHRFTGTIPSTAELDGILNESLAAERKNLNLIAHTQMINDQTGNVTFSDKIRTAQEGLSFEVPMEENDVRQLGQRLTEQFHRLLKENYGVSPYDAAEISTLQNEPYAVRFEREVIDALERLKQDMAADLLKVRLRSELVQKRRELVSR